MDKPLCKICQQKHWPRDPHIWKEKTDLPDIVLPMTERVEKVKLKEARVAFDRVAYQREYMRNIYRPKVKLKKNAPITP